MSETSWESQLWPSSKTRAELAQIAYDAALRLVGIECPQRGGCGEIDVTEIVGEVSADMASDAGEPSMRGQPVYGKVPHRCTVCEGLGRVMPKVVDV